MSYRNSNNSSSSSSRRSNQIIDTEDDMVESDSETDSSMVEEDDEELNQKDEEEDEIDEDDDDDEEFQRYVGEDDIGDDDDEDNGSTTTSLEDETDLRNVEFDTDIQGSSSTTSNNITGVTKRNTSRPSKVDREVELLLNRSKVLCKEVKKLKDNAYQDGSDYEESVFSKIIRYSIGILLFLATIYYTMGWMGDIRSRKGSLELEEDNVNLVKVEWDIEKITEFKSELITKLKESGDANIQMFKGKNIVNSILGIDLFVDTYFDHYSTLYMRTKSNQILAPLSYHISYPVEFESSVINLLTLFEKQIRELSNITTTTCLKTIQLNNNNNDNPDGLKQLYKDINDIPKECIDHGVIYLISGFKEEPSLLGQLESIFDGSAKLDQKQSYSFALNHTFILLSNVGQPSVGEFYNKVYPKAGTSYAQLEMMKENIQETMVERLITETKKVWQHRFCTRITKMIPILNV